MATVRVSEKEAIERGWIEPPKQPVSTPSHQLPTIANIGAAAISMFVLGWVTGFVCGLLVG